ncbi:hypothetical protein, variant [Verruconis gallopava]|nr:hypothetical protein, variant [Verruconis gallopava]KIV99705.1 hypothetical protein, variant [Verruconis gallopava]
MAQYLDLEFPTLAPPSSSACSSSAPAVPSPRVENLASNSHSEWQTHHVVAESPSIISLPTSTPSGPSQLNLASRLNGTLFVPIIASNSEGEICASESETDSLDGSPVHLKEQSDAIQALLNRNLTGESTFDRGDIGLLHLDRAVFENNLLGVMKEHIERAGPLLAGPIPPRRRSASGSDEAQTWKSTFTLKSSLSMSGASKEVEKIKNSAAFIYTVNLAPTGSDVWPDIRDPSKAPARYSPISLEYPSAWSGSQARIFTWKIKYAQCDGGGKLNDEISTKLIWPMKALPSEIYYLIADSLSRDDIKAMRLTCKEFEHQISSLLFKTVVVPFNTEIYGMLNDIASIKNRVKSSGKGKAKATMPPSLAFWENSRDEDIYTGHGIDVFRSFGSRIRRFGMCFEVREEVLADPPLKGMREDHKSYWGVYQWPYPEYRRFDQVAGLEDAADETPKMKTAFSFLTEVQELALSLDAGLGWLSGPDRSIRSRVLGSRRPIFGAAKPIRDRCQEARHALWQYLNEWASRNANVELKHCTIAAMKFDGLMSQNSNPLGNLDSICESELPFMDMHDLTDPTVEVLPFFPDLSPQSKIGSSLAADAVTMDGQHSNNNAFEKSKSNPQPLESGVFFVQEDSLDPDRLERHPIIPAELSKLQKEWLLETEWAQRAFLSSWLIAVVDNQHAFKHVHTLNFSSISSRFLLSLCREDFWRALPQLENVAISVIPDYRDVVKDSAGFVNAPCISLASAVWLLHKLLAEMIALRSTIKSLTVGWASGGELAQGLMARNKNLMPAPGLPPEWLRSAESLANKQLLEDRFLKFPHLRELKLKNCWLSPHALVHLVQEHPALERLCLESVSLTAELIHSPAQNAGQLMAAAPQIQAPLISQNNIPLHGGYIGLPNSQHLPQAAFVQSAQGSSNPAFVPGPHQVPPEQPNFANRDWLSPRIGSWPHVLDSISPGVTLAASGSTMSPMNIPSSVPNHALHTLSLRSCGYCRLNNSRLDESSIPVPTYEGGSGWFQRRSAALSKLMLVAKGYITADIVQALPRNEEHALTMGFELSLGWPAEWADEVDAPLYDACLAGGSGRFHGIITRDSRIKIAPK